MWSPVSGIGSGGSFGRGLRQRVKDLIQLVDHGFDDQLAFGKKRTVNSRDYRIGGGEGHETAGQRGHLSGQCGAFCSVLFIQDKIKRAGQIFVYLPDGLVEAPKPGFNFGSEVGRWAKTRRISDLTVATPSSAMLRTPGHSSRALPSFMADTPAVP